MARKLQKPIWIQHHPSSQRNQLTSPSATAAAGPREDSLEEASTCKEHGTRRYELWWV